MSFTCLCITRLRRDVSASWVTDNRAKRFTSELIAWCASRDKAMGKPFRRRAVVAATILSPIDQAGALYTGAIRKNTSPSTILNENPRSALECGGLMPPWLFVRGSLRRRRQAAALQGGYRREARKNRPKLRNEATISFGISEDLAGTPKPAAFHGFPVVSHLTV